MMKTKKTDHVDTGEDFINDDDDCDGDKDNDNEC